MQYYQWTIGSTSVRNPDRLRDGLKLLKEHFEGKAWGLLQQETFFKLLKETGTYEKDEESYQGMTSARQQEHARKWVSILNQLGFCYAYESSAKPVIITDAGIALLNNPEIEDEIFLRQLLKYQKPCALPKQSGKGFKNVAILPFIASLKIIYSLNGITKEEISIFLNTTIRMKDIKKVIEQIKVYRIDKSKISGRVKKKEYYYKMQSSRLKEIFKDEVTKRNSLIRRLEIGYDKSKNIIKTPIGKRLLHEITKGGKGSKTAKAQKTKQLIIEALKNNSGTFNLQRIFLDYFLPLKVATLKDYADLTARYLRKSGLFSVSRDRLIVITEKKEFIKYLLQQKWGLVKDSDYFNYLWSATLPEMPSDKTDYLNRHFENISQKEKLLFNQLSKKQKVESIGDKIQKAANVIGLKNQVRQIEKNVSRLKEINYYYSQGDEKQIDDIINYYDLIMKKQILGGEAYYPAYLEWNTWRAFLAINTLANQPYEARNFNLDDELQPLNHAPGNMADMVFVYKDFISVIEVTLNTKENQWSAEAEPVPRHVAKIHETYKDKKVYGVFIAPSIDTNTVLTFFNNRQHSVGGKIIELTIIPFTITQIKELLAIFKTKRFSIQKLKNLYQNIGAEITKNKNATEWYAKIPAILNIWAENL